MAVKDEFLRLTEQDIRARCTEASFKRGQDYYASGAVERRTRLETGVEAEVAGSQVYRVTAWPAPEGFQARCTCPYDYGGYCKHIVAALLAWLHEPDSFRPPVDLERILNSRTKKELVALLVDILTVHPHLVDDFGIAGGAKQDKDLPDQAAAIFEALAPWGHLSEAEAEARMDIVARRAGQLAGQGQADLARRAYYTLVYGCVDLCRSYGSYDHFSAHVPYDYALAYDDLAAEQVPEQGAVIKAEIEELYRDVDNPDLLGLDQALGDTWDKLIEYGLVEEGQ